MNDSIKKNNFKDAVSDVKIFTSDNAKAIGITTHLLKSGEMAPTFLARAIEQVCAVMKADDKNFKIYDCKQDVMRNFQVVQMAECFALLQNKATKAELSTLEARMNGTFFALRMV